MSLHSHAARHSWLVSHSPVFYGWVVLAAAAVGTIASAPGQSFSVSLFTDYFIQDLNVDRTTVSGLYGTGTFVASLALVWVGRQIDRHGNRKVSAAVAVAFAAAVMAVSLVSGPFGLLIAFIAVRGLGQGALGLVCSTAVAQWFRRRRGRVLSLIFVLSALSQRVYLPWLQGVIDTAGWRQAWIILGLGTGIIAVPVLWLLLRDSPEQFGLEPDGRAADVEATSERNWRLGQAMHAPVFWVFLATRTVSMSVGTALIFHQVSIFGAMGHSPATAAETYGQSALFTAAFTLLAGRLVDTLAPRYVLALQMAGLAAAATLAMTMTESWMLLYYSAFTGVFMGIGAVFDGTVWTNLFGRRYQGAIRGFVATAGVASTAIGPVVFGYAHDYLGGYPPALWAGIGLAVVALAANLLIRMPSNMMNQRA